MIVDSSALMAILLDEPERDLFTQLITDGPCTMSAATHVEWSIVSAKVSTPTEADELIASLGIEVVPFTPHQALLARRAHQRYGRGRGSPARLNLGDCFSYALSVDTGEPLLFKGDDFTHTDVLPAV